jgi:5-bromo-4-chloroindolyl phosphate hydrolysis protein
MLVFAVLGTAGYLLFYGRDPKRRHFNVTEAAGVDIDTVTMQLKQAYGRLQGIDAAARSIAVPEFVERLQRIIGIGKKILEEIERDPRDASRARRFLNIYLDSAERVVTEYARTHRQIRNRPLEENFRQLLIDMEETFEIQHQKLLENDLLSLDVDIEVLNARLKREGV